MGLRQGLTEAIFALQPGRQRASLAKMRGKSIPGQGRDKGKDSEPGSSLGPGSGAGRAFMGSILHARESTGGPARAAAGSLGAGRG